MTPTEIASVLKQYTEHGLKMLKEYGTISPNIYAHSKTDGTISLTLSFLNSEKKSHYFEMYKKVIQAYDVQYYVVILEAWRAVLTPEERLAGVTASKAKNKSSCANFIFVSPTKTIMHTYTFHKDINDRIGFIEEPEKTELSYIQTEIDPTLSLFSFDYLMSDEEKKHVQILMPVQDAASLVYTKIMH